MRAGSTPPKHSGNLGLASGIWRQASCSAGILGNPEINQSFQENPRRQSFYAPCLGEVAALITPSVAVCDSVAIRFILVAMSALVFLRISYHS